MAVVRVAVDARNLERDWRGIARYVRAVLTRFAMRDDVTVHLVRDGLLGSRVPRGVDVVWHPWNGTFFSSRAPSVVTFHDAVPFRFPPADPRRRRNDQAPWLRSAAEASQFLANSHFTVDEVSRYLGVAPERQTVTYLAVEPDVFTPEGPAARVSDGRPYVLFAGADEPRKNLRTLVAAHARAFPRGEVALAVAGSTPAGDALALGTLEPTELARWYRGALAVAVPSYYEGFGFPLLEALACGAPAIASRVTALPEVGGDGCAWIDDPLDVGAWSDALRELADDPAARDRLRVAGLARAGAFSWERCAEQTLAVLRCAAHAPA
jgi:glycosyltransferase involved in cell wall biosynthesis